MLRFVGIGRLDDKTHTLGEWVTDDIHTPERQTYERWIEGLLSYATALDSRECSADGASSVFHRALMVRQESGDDNQPANMVPSAKAQPKRHLESKVHLHWACRRRSSPSAAVVVFLAFVSHDDTHSTNSTHSNGPDQSNDNSARRSSEIISKLQDAVDSAGIDLWTSPAGSSAIAAALSQVAAAYTPTITKIIAQAGAGGSDKLDAVRDRLLDVTDQMRANMTSVVERGEAIAVLDEKASTLDTQAIEFRNKATAVRRTMCCKQYQMCVIIVAIILLLVLLIVLPLALAESR